MAHPPGGQGLRDIITTIGGAYRIKGWAHGEPGIGQPAEGVLTDLEVSGTLTLASARRVTA